ncbi:hypothetical protein PMAYCL1PPCAC_19136, partial [Pristionchus mayeri]
ARFKIFRCHVTVLGILFDCVNSFLFLLLLSGTSVAQSDVQGECKGGTNDSERCSMAIGLLITAIVLTVAEIFSTGFLITAVLYRKEGLVVVPLVVSYLNILVVLIFTILSILDICKDKKIADYIMRIFTSDPSKNAVLTVAILLCCLLVLALLYCILNTFVHTRIWQYYKRMREEEEWMSETTSQISIIATFSMDMIYDEYPKKEDR